MPVIATDRTMLPLRVVVESLGVVVTYNAITRVIRIVWTHEGEAFRSYFPCPSTRLKASGESVNASMDCTSPAGTWTSRGPAAYGPT